ncbi:DUF3367 domain-containing protein [Candidatus Bathyarchaeota archaeon]|nr:DUF3367 domain-containing protein [Candidatus Bathyarchaeota archaeon]
MSLSLSNIKRLIKAFLTSRLFDLLLIGALAIIPFWNSGTQGLMEPLETVFPLNPSHFLEAFGGRWAWQPLVFFGLDFTQSLPFITYYGPLAILHDVLFIPLALLQRLWSILLVAACGWSMYFLSSTIIPSTLSKKRIACFVSALFYMFNPWIIAIMRAATIGPYVYTVSMTPLFLGLFIKGLQSQRNQYIYAALIAFASLSQVLGIQLFLDQAILLALLYFVFYLATCGSKNNAKRAFKFTGLAAVFSFLVNMRWILPSILDLLPVYTQQAANIAERTVGSVSYLNIFRIYLNSWPFEQYYNSALGVVVGVVIALLVFSTLLMYNLRDYLGRHVYFFGVLSVVLSVLMAGDRPPFGFIYRFLLFGVPGGIVIFPFDTGKFATTLLVPFAVLLGVSTISLPRVFNKIRLRSRPIFRKLFSAVIPLVVCVLILLNANPLMTSANLGGLISPVKIPDYYYSTQDWLSRQNSDFRFFVVPSPYMQGQTKYAWAPYSMSDIICQLPKQPVTDWPGSLLLGKDIVRLIQSKILSGNDTGVSSILGLMNVKYVMVRRDLDPNYHGQHDYNAIEKALLESGDFSLGPTFGQWSFYENKDFSNSIFVARNIVSVVGSEDALTSLAQYEGLALNSSAFLFLNSLSENERTDALRASNFVFIANSTVDEHIKAEILSSGIRQLYEFTPETPQVDILKDGTYLVKPPVGQNLDNTQLLVNGSISYVNSTLPVVYLPAGLQTLGMGTDIKNSSVVTGYNGMQVETENSTPNNIVKGSLSTPMSSTYGINFTNSESTWNFTETRNIEFSLYDNNTESLSMGVILYDYNGSYRQWTIPTPQNESWTDIVLSLDSPSVGSTEQLDYSKVKSVVLYTFIGSPANNSYQFLVKTFSALSGNGAFLLSTNSETEPASGITSTVQGKPTNVTYTTVNPTLYKVKVETSSPFFLVLSNSYHPMWKVFIEGQEINPIETNSFANGYLINKTGTYELTVEFVVQKYVDIGGLISIFSAVILALSVSVILLHRRGIMKKCLKGKFKLRIVQKKIVLS